MDALGQVAREATDPDQPLTGLAMVIGGGTGQIDIIRRAKELGLRTLVTDISETAVGRAVADTFIVIDTNNKEGLLEIARRYAPSLVIAEQSDRTVPIAAFLNDQLGLRGIRPETAHRFTNKYAMRNGLVGSGVGMPQYGILNTAEEAADFAREHGYPVVLKPPASQASLGVFKVNDEVELRRRFEDTRREARDGQVLIEQFIDGTEITVEGFSVAGRNRALAISEKEHYTFNPCVARRLAYPPRFAPEVMERISSAAQKVVETLGLVDGISHAEYRVRDGYPYLVEVAARGGGNRIAPMIVPHVSGVDIYELFIRRLIGQDAQMPPLKKRAAVLEFLHFNRGRVKAIHGVDRVLDESLASDLQFQFSPGDVLKDPTDDRTRHAYFISLGETRDEVDVKSAKIKELLRVEYEGGQ